MDIFAKQMIEGIKQIRQLQEINYFAVHRVEDRDGAEYDQVSIIAEDVTGKRIEIFFPVQSTTTGDIGKGQQQVAETLTALLVRRVCNCKQVDVEPAYNEYLQTGEIDKLIQIGRTAAPYTGKKWINEERARLFDHVESEYMY